MNKQKALVKLAQVRLAINHVLRQRMMKQGATVSGVQSNRNPKVKPVPTHVLRGAEPATNLVPKTPQAELDSALQDLRSLGYKGTPAWYRRGTQLNQQKK